MPENISIYTAWPQPDLDPLPEGCRNLCLEQSLRGDHGLSCRRVRACAGPQVIALTKHRGIRTINVVWRQEQRQELLDLGCSHSLSAQSPLEATQRMTLMSLLCSY